MTIKPAVSAMKDAAHFVCNYSGWRVSHLELQKILYLAQMAHLAVHKGVPIFDEDFEAWHFGPVIPELYQMLKHLGSGRISHDTFSNAGAIGRDKPLYEFLEESCRFLVTIPGWRLVGITHSEDGAWAKYYEPGLRGIVIPKEAMIDEYKTRFGGE